MTDKTKKIMLLIIIADVLLCFYISGAMDGTSYGLSSYGPFSILKSTIEHGVSWDIFLMLFIGSMLAIYYFYNKYKLSLFDNDPLNRKLKYASERQPYGESHFEKPYEYKDVALVQNWKDAEGIIFGQLDDSGKHLINFRMDSRLNQHMAVIGASGSGKTFTFTKPACFQYVKRGQSVIITDPDGGLYRDMAGYFQDHGYIVRRLDLKNLEKSDGWNCLQSIKGSNIEINAQLFANTVIANLTDDLTSIYAQGPMSILKALILKVMLSPDYSEEEKNIGTVYELLQNPDGEAFLDTLFDPSQLTEEEMPCHGPYMSFKQGSPNLRGNLITNLSTQLQLLQSKLVRKVLSTDGIDLELPGKKKCAYFCLFPDSHDTFRFVVSLFFSMLFMRLVDYADNNVENDGKLDVPVNFLLDEFPSIGIIPDFDRKMATIRKRSMNVTMIFQDITQLRNNYLDSWVTLMSNCATWYCLGINDLETAEFIQLRLGDTTIQVQTEQHAAMESYIQAWHRHSTGEGKRALLSIDELFKLDKDTSLVIFQYHNPILAKKYPFILHPEHKKMRKIDASKLPDIDDEEGRKKMYEEEAKRVAIINGEYEGDDEMFEKFGDMLQDAKTSLSERKERLKDEDEEDSSVGYALKEIKRVSYNAFVDAEPYLDKARRKIKKEAKKIKKEYFAKKDDKPEDIMKLNDDDNSDYKIFKKNDVPVKTKDRFTEEDLASSIEESGIIWEEMDSSFLFEDPPAAGKSELGDSEEMTEHEEEPVQDIDQAHEDPDDYTEVPDETSVEEPQSSESEEPAQKDLDSIVGQDTVKESQAVSEPESNPNADPPVEAPPKKSGNELMRERYEKAKQKTKEPAVVGLGSLNRNEIIGNSFDSIGHTYTTKQEASKPSKRTNLPGKKGRGLK